LGALTSACRRRGRIHGLVGLVAVLVALAGATGVRADPGAGAGEGTPAAETAAGGAGGSESTSAAENAAGGPEASESTPAAENAAGGPAGASESTPAAENAAGGPGNTENTPAAQNAAGGPGGTQETAQGAGVGQAAGASASAAQEQVGNTQVTVRVDEPGNGPPVVQQNEAEAGAQASASATLDTPSSEVQQEASAEAGAAQEDVSNTAVVVRVGSPGDDAGVTQTNAASGTADAAVGGGDSAASSAVASATQEDVGNTSVSVRVFSPGDDGPVTQLNDASAVADAGGSGAEDATAQQDGVRNTSVSIRVDSPGSAAEVSQQSEANAAVSAGDADGSTAVAVTSDAVDTVLTIAVAGSDLERPGPAGLVIWEWTWTWQGDESNGLGDLTATAVSSWDWNWNDTSAGASNRRGNVTSRAARDDEAGRRAGTWEWSWQWSREGVQGWSWLWNWQETLSCNSCIWIWNWTWTWTGQPLGTGAAEPPPADVISVSVPPPGQLNAARATAEASVTADATQIATQEASGPGTQFVGQLVEIGQDAEARADARQGDVISISRGIGAPGQSNLVLSDASVVLDASVVQDAEQILAANDVSVAEQWIGQQVDVGQSGSADAMSSQNNATLTGQGTHEATGRAVSDIESDIAQRIFQGGHVDGGRSEQWAGQLALVEQIADATSSVAQTGTAPSRSTGGTARAAAFAGDLALVEQTSDQAATRGAGEGSQVVQQLVFAAQDGSAHATTAQQAGASVSPVASSEAEATNRAAVVQVASQAATGTSGLDIQELAQESIVVQVAVATSISNGGIGGRATVVNCAVTQQGAAQAIGAAAAPARAADLSTFCFPAALAPTSSPADGPPSTVAEALPASAVPVGGTVTTAMVSDDVEPTIFRGGRGTLSAGPHAATRGAPGRVAPFDRHAVPPEAGPPAPNKLSAPHSTQARLDTRPGSNAGAGDAGTEPPLPPAGDPPTWVSALAAAVAGGGSTGIAAILLAFALMPPLMLRTREASAVRRPTDVLAPIDVPV
jgi:hypothetical protein